MSAVSATVPSTCCGRDGKGCACAQEATCSCGKQPALKCNCEKSSSENILSGELCSCKQRTKGACTCSRSQMGSGAPGMETEIK